MPSELQVIVNKPLVEVKLLPKSKKLIRWLVLALAPDAYTMAPDAVIVLEDQTTSDASNVLLSFDVLIVSVFPDSKTPPRLYPAPTTWFAPISPVTVWVSIFGVYEPETSRTLILS